MNSFYDLMLFFTIYSFLGWILETVHASIVQRKIVNRGFLTGFVCPIYGFGAVLAYQCSKLGSVVFKNYLFSLIINIVISIILVTILEYITGFILEKLFNCKWWDYSDNYLNLHGYICLKFSLLWGLLTFLLIKIIHPSVSKVVSLIPASIKGYLTLLIIVCFIVDVVKSVIDALDLRKVILNYSDITVEKYHEKIIQYKRFFLAFPRLLRLNADIINRDIRSILYDRVGKIKVEIKNKFHK